METDAYCWVKTCYVCQLVSRYPSPKAMTGRVLPSRARECISVDFLGPLQSGEYILVVVDYYSGHSEVAVTRSVTAAEVNVL